MHDIICPRCGERYIARDVAFDISEFVVDLLYDNDKNDQRTTVSEIKFKYYIDEETIEKTHVQGSGNILECGAAAGPAGGWNWYQCKITKKTIWAYIKEKCDMAYSFQIESLVDKLYEWMTSSQTPSVSGTRTRTRQQDGAPNQNEATTPVPETPRVSRVLINNIEKQNFILACRLLFGGSGFEMQINDKGIATSNALTQFDADRKVKTAIQILKHLKDSNTDIGITFRVATYSVDAIPNSLFIKTDSGNIKKQKICRYCGYHLPDEFGRYPIKTVVVLGSHNAGKTSFLVSLLHTIETQAPFANNVFGRTQGLRCSKLTNDPDIALWETKLRSFRRACRMEKTPIERQPVLNIKVQKPGTNQYVIYSFVDWAGEVFITNNANDQDSSLLDPLRYQKLFRWTRHLVMFLEPTQICSLIPPNEENNANVNFSISALVDRLRAHLTQLAGGKLNSLTSVLCQADRFGPSARFEGLPMASNMLRQMNLTNANSVYNGTWNGSTVANLENEAVKFLQQINPTVSATLANTTNGIDNFAHLNLRYIPVSPYGQDVNGNPQPENINMADGEQPIKSQCVGIPFLMFLHEDGII